MKILIGTLFVAACLSLMYMHGGGTKKPPRGKVPPNIVLINIDDLGFHDLGVYGSLLHQTPNVDGFKKESVSFRQAYANYPRCLPSRFAMMTATYPVKEFEGDLTAVKEENNFIKKFAKAGYTSFYVGKWHLGSGKMGPVDFGFTRSFAANDAGGVASHFYPYNTEKIINPMNTETAPVPDVEQKGKKGDFLFDLLTTELLSFIQNHDKAKPFFAVLAPYSVHSPFQAKEEDIERNKTEARNLDFSGRPEFVTEGNGFTKMRQDDPVYAAMVENADWNVGRVLKAIEDSGLRENTIVVLTSDHGGMSNRGTVERRLATSNYPLRAGKGHLYEGGVRVPLMVRWPSRIKPAEDRQSTVALMDLMPTLLDMAIGDSLAQVDGKSFFRVLQKKANWGDRPLFFYEKMARPALTGDFPGAALRTGNYKLLHFFNDDRYELYDLAADPSERHNLVGEEPQLARQMKQDLDQWLKAKTNHSIK